MGMRTVISPVFLLMTEDASVVTALMSSSGATEKNEVLLRTLLMRPSWAFAAAVSARQSKAPNNFDKEMICTIPASSYILLQTWAAGVQF